MTTFSTFRRRRNLIAALIAAAAIGTGTLLAGSPASADPTYLDPKSSVMVTQLGMSSDTGFLTIQAHIGADHMFGFEVVIPAGSGTWALPGAQFVSALGVRCFGVPGANFDYVCGADTHETGDRSELPQGNYQITVRAKYSGPATTGLWGTTYAYKTDAYGEPFGSSYDTFPVVNAASHFRSTAEVANYHPSDLYGQGLGELAISATIVPGESVMAIDTTLPTTPGAHYKLWNIKYNPGLTCAVIHATGADTFHCTSLNAGHAIPPSRFTVVLQTGFTGALPDQDGSVALQLGSAAPEPVDTFPVLYDINNY